MSVRSSYDFLLGPCGLPTISGFLIGSAYFFKNCKSADYFKIVDATEIVGSRRIVGTSQGHPAETVRKCVNAKIGII